MTAMAMTEQTHCPECGTLLPPGSTSSECPNCLLGLGLGSANSRSADGELPTHVEPDAPPSGLGATPRFGDYELIEEIARGGMGVVYKARQKSLDRIVAVKMILAGAFAGHQLIQRFRAEVTAAALLKHPNIVPIHEVGIQGGQHFFSMEYVEGQTLSQLVGHRPLPAQTAARYVRGIAEAIQYAHQQGILHRDLKPSNVLIDAATDQPRVTDFGLAKRLDGESSITVTGQVLGSPNFMPPEQAGGSRGKVGRRSDVYGLGGILYYALTARAPFQGATIETTIHEVLNTEPLSPRVLNPSVPRDLETICLKCLEKEPEKRYPTAAALAEELERFGRDEPIQARPVGRLEKGWRWCRRKPALAGSLASAALLLLVVSIGSPLVALHFKRARQVTALNLYAADIKGANTALEEHDLLGARKLLDQISDSPDQRELRGWEWRYLMGQCRSDELATLGTHDKWVEGVAFSPDDKVLVSISGDGVAKLWDWKLRKEILSWQAHRPVLKHERMMPAHAVMFLPGTSILATTGADELVHLWNLGSTSPLVSFSSPSDETGLLDCTRDGRLLATRSGNQVVLWDISDPRQPKQVARLDTKLRYIFEVLFLPDGRSLLASSGPEGIQWWDISNVEQPRQKETPPQGRLSMALSPDGRLLVSDFTLWDVESLETKAGRSLAESRGAYAHVFNFSPDGRSLISSESFGNIVFRDLRAERLPVTLQGHDEPVWSLAITSDGRTMASASLDKTVRLWDVADIWRDGPNKEPLRQHRAVALAFSPDAKYLASISWEDPRKEKALGLPAASLRLWDAATRTETASVPIRHRVGFLRIVFSPDGQTLVFEDQGRLHFRAVPSLQAVTNWPGYRPAYSKDGSALVYGVTNRLVRRNLVTGEEVLIGELKDGAVALALSPDGRTVVTSGHNSGGVMTFWDALGQSKPVSVERHLGSRVEQVAFSPDGQTLASAGYDGKLGLWSVKERRNLGMLRGHKGLVCSVAFSPDGRTVATSSGDTTVRLWNLATRREVVVLRLDVVWPIAFSPDSQWLATGGGAIRFWHAPTFEELALGQHAKEEGK
jgi:WD40 repeat protein/serine/threonine protein kinase